MSRRKVRPEELELWAEVARSTRKLSKSEKPARAPSTPAPKEPPPRAPGAAPLPRFSLGEAAATRPKGYSRPETTAGRLARDPVAMDSKAFTRMKRGKLKPEGRIDLHGMTLDRAHPALVRFILSSQARGLRLVLVITGKGQREDPYDPAPRRRGVLKSQVPQWLRMAPLGAAVLQISEAHIRHGGGGAYYVYLRRLR
ncbi:MULTISPECIES: Smr/MutS family protein [unclassified Roseivivax]|uniref:Smr/MutS family protein n=1 Tax=Roseivivax sp. GX 12232 TaxID=2900547 RepID=UPI001E5A30A6|nr:Smr/MutS family protein [Roseivivax sp. GX 12232]MCE0506275.1 Smr/MutS family protein [Roseivivax sp. GX 12232]